MMSSFTDQQIQEFQETFLIFDNFGDKKISASQIGDVLRALGQNPTEAEVKKCQDQLKPEDRISFDVFLPMIGLISKAKLKYTADEFVDGLRHFDNDMSGYISSAELRQLLTGLGEKLTDEEVEQLMVGMEDEDGKVNYDHFVRQIIKE